MIPSIYSCAVAAQADSAIKRYGASSYSSASNATITWHALSLTNFPEFFCQFSPKLYTAYTAFWSNLGVSYAGITCSCSHSSTARSRTTNTPSLSRITSLSEAYTPRWQPALWSEEENYPAFIFYLMQQFCLHPLMNSSDNITDGLRSDRFFAYPQHKLNDNFTIV